MLARIHNVIRTPVVHLQRNKMLQASEPPTYEDKICSFGSYCVKVTVNTYDLDNIVDRTFIGYSEDMDIIRKTHVACERFKRSGTKCGDSSLSMKRGGCDEVILMKKKNGDVNRLI
jgi:hypothetical protein